MALASDLSPTVSEKPHSVLTARSTEYVEDTRSLILGRYAMFSLKWSFGKMNPAKNARVQDAMYNMM